LPHPEQRSKLGFDWREGDFDYNLRQMLAASLRYAQNAYPDIQKIDYDFATGRFVANDALAVENAGGASYDAGVSLTSDQRAKIVETARAEGFEGGINTLERAIVTQSILRQQNSDVGRGQLLEDIGKAGGLEKNPLRGRLYSKAAGQTNQWGGVSVPAAPP
jgi:hypothetical protein